MPMFWLALATPGGQSFLRCHIIISLPISFDLNACTYSSLVILLLIPSVFPSFPHSPALCFFFLFHFSVFFSLFFSISVKACLPALTLIAVPFFSTCVHFPHFSIYLSPLFCSLSYYFVLAVV